MRQTLGLIVTWMMLIGVAHAADLRTEAVAVLPEGGYVPDRTANASAVADAKGGDLAKALVRKLGGKPDAMVFFCEEEGQIRRLVAEIRGALPKVPLIGCRTPRGFFFDEDDAILSACTLIGLKGEGVTVKAGGVAYKDEKEMVEAGARLAKQLKPEDGRGVFFLLTDARISHGWDPVPMYQAMQKQFGRQVVFAGGNATYGERSLIVYNDDVALKQHAGLMISGPVVYKMFADPAKPVISKPLAVTKVENGNEIVELDGKPWEEVYKAALQPHLPAAALKEVFGPDADAKGWKKHKIGRHYPFAVLLEHDEPLIRYSPGLRGKLQTGRRLPVGVLAAEDMGKPIVITKPEPKQVEKHITPAFARLGKGMPAGSNLTLFTPCESELRLSQQEYYKTFIGGMKDLVAAKGAIFGFFPCGEHGSWFDPARDRQVGPARYHQLSYPMARVVASAAAAAALKGDANSIYVDVEAEAGDGSPQKPFPTITEALAAWKERAPSAKERVSIHVAAGAYKPKADGGKETIPADGWEIDGLVRIVGSYQRTGMLWTLKPNPTGKVEPGYPTTVIDLGGRGRAFDITAKREGKTNARNLGKQPNTVRIQGLALRNGATDGDGGAIRADCTAGVEILNCEFENNRAGGHGGALYRTDPGRAAAWLGVRQCVFKSNHATGEQSWGGAIYSDCWSFVTKNLAYRNRAAHGAVMGGKSAVGNWAINMLMAYANTGDFVLNRHSRIMEQRNLIGGEPRFRPDDGVSPFGGYGTVYSERMGGTAISLMCSAISDNAAGGVRLVEPAHEPFSDNLQYFYGMLGCVSIISGNEGVGVYYDSGRSANSTVIQRCNVWGNKGGDFAGEAAAGAGCISADPRYRDNDHADLDQRDYRLAEGSPCIGAVWVCGVDLYAWSQKEPRDLGGEEQKGTGVITLGPYAGSAVATADTGRFAKVYPHADERMDWVDVYVDRNWDGPEKGTKDAPYRSVSKAVSSIFGVWHNSKLRVWSVRVADGVYDRSIESFGVNGISIWNDRVNIYGGYAGLRDDGTFDWTEDSRKPRSTILDAQGKSRILTHLNYATIKVDGVTFRNGWSASNGGAVHFGWGEACTYSFRNCRFENNVSLQDGGAIWARSGSIPAYLDNCEFVNNQASGSGGAVSWGTWEESLPFLVRDCRFEGNLAGRDGGALHTGNERGTLVEASVFEDNRATGNGGAVHLQEKSPTLFRRCRFLGNHATDGGAVFNGGTIMTLFQGCLIRGNGGEFAVSCLLRPSMFRGEVRGTRPRWRQLWQVWKLQKPVLPGLYLEFCTVADNTGGGVRYADTNPKPVNADTAGVEVVDSVFANNDGPAVADTSGNGNTRKGTVEWTLFHGNRAKLDGNLALGAGCLEADPRLTHDGRLAADTPVAPTRGVKRYEDLNGETVAVHPGYRMGAFGLTDDRSVPHGDWKPATHTFHIDPTAEGEPNRLVADFRQLAQQINKRERTHRWADVYQVHVAPGTYTIAADNGDEGVVFEKGRIQLIADGDVTIDGQGKSRALAAATSYDVSLTVEGITFRNCASQRGGGAIRLYGGLESIGGVGRSGLTLTNCRFVDCRTEMIGGAVHVGANSRDVTITDCQFTRNTAQVGGGLHIMTAIYGRGLEKDVTLTGCRFFGNEAWSGGGGLYASRSRGTFAVEDCAFLYNRANWQEFRRWTLALKGGGAVLLLFSPELPFDFHNAEQVDWPGQMWALPGFHRLVQKIEAGTFRACRFYGNEGSAYPGDGQTPRMRSRGAVFDCAPILAATHEQSMFSLPPWNLRDSKVDARSWKDIETHIPLNRQQGTESYTDDEAYRALLAYLKDADATEAKRWAVERLAREPRWDAVTTAAAYLDDKDLAPTAAYAVICGAHFSNTGALPEDRQDAVVAALKQAGAILTDAKVQVPSRKYGDWPTLAAVTVQSILTKPAVAERVETAPELDGTLDDACWQGKPDLSGFKVANKEQDADADTHVYVAYDQEHLLLAFRCREPEPGKIKTAAQKRDDPSYKDDSVEVFLDTNLDRETAFQVVINANGTVFDQKDNKGPDWNGNYTLKTGREKGAWTLELAIPWKTLGMDAPKAGTELGLNVCRNRVGAQQELTRWVDTGMFNYNPNRFGTLRFE